MGSNFTLFTSDANSANSGSAFDQDSFQDFSLPADSNAGLTDSAATNPLAGFFGNDDGVRYGAKTLYIKDLVLVEDHALWVDNKPTYRIIWNENYSQIGGYLFGNVQLNEASFPPGKTGAIQKYFSIRQAGDGIGITGVLRKCAFLVTTDTAATATAQLAVDGANTTTIDFSNASNPLLDENGTTLTDNKYAAFVNSSSNATHDLHDFRLTAIQTNTLRLLGVVVYQETSTQNIEVFPGETYNNKTKISTTVGATFGLPSYSGAIGGRALVYKNAAAGYSMAIQPAPNLQSIATGSSGTNLMNVTTGEGGSFPTGSGFAAFWGNTGFIGSVVLQSTDTLTVSPTLPFGISGLIYKTFQSGSTYAINSSQLILWNSFDLNQLQGFTNFFAEPTGQYRVWGKALGFTLVDTIWPAVTCQNVSLGFIQVDGFFSGADIEFVGQGVLHATFNVNGFPAFGINAGQTGCVKRTVFTDAGPGWNSFNISIGASYSGIGINRINLFQRALPQGLSFGNLAYLDTLPNFVQPSAVNATNVALGTYHRYFADQLFLQGSWERGSTHTAAGGIFYRGASTNSVLKFQYYGKNYAVLGVNNGQSMTVAVDGGAATGVTLNVMNTVASEGFHSIVLTGNSISGIIHAVDVTRTQSEVVSLQQKGAIPPVPDDANSYNTHEVWVTDTTDGNGNVGTAVRLFKTVIKNIGTAITYFADPANDAGDTFTINETGTYSLIYSDSFGAAVSFGVANNSTDQTQNITTDPYPIRLGATTTAASGEGAALSLTVQLNKGDVLRCKSNASTSTNGDIFGQFRIIKLRDK